MIVNYKLRTDNIWDTESRVAKVREIRDWLDELVLWDKSMYQITFHSSGQIMKVWFEHDKDAVLFILKWI